MSLGAVHGLLSSPVGLLASKNADHLTYTFVSGFSVAMSVAQFGAAVGSSFAPAMWSMMMRIPGYLVASATTWTFGLVSVVPVPRLMRSSVSPCFCTSARLAFCVASVRSILPLHRYTRRPTILSAFGLFVASTFRYAARFVMKSADVM